MRIYPLIAFLLIFSICEGLTQSLPNVFSPVTAFSLGTQACNGTGTPTTITISTNSADFAVDKKVLIIQMKGASVNTTVAEPPTPALDGTFGSITAYNEAGNYEFAIVKVNPGGSPATISFYQPLVNVYDPLKGPVQLVSVPQYTNLTISAPLTGTPWNGTIGGVLVFEVGGALTLSSSISMDNAGFIGGSVIGDNLPSLTGCDGGLYTMPAKPTLVTQSTSRRGEGIGMNAEAYGRGAWANGGGSGSGHNGGGAGGGNYCKGGIGGYEFSVCYNTAAQPTPYFSTIPNYTPSGIATRRQALGGYVVTPTATKVFMGGGGGAGNGDDGAATPGGNGGGIIIITAGTITGSGGSISANGQAGWRNGLAPYGGTSDGVGGGGAGGSILLNISIYTIAGLTVTANGGKGGDNYQNATCHGSGGGGGAGYVAFAGLSIPASASVSAIGGVSGETAPDRTSATDPQCEQSNYGAQPGSSCGAPATNLGLNAKVCPCSVPNLGPDKTFCGNPTIILSNGTASNTVFGGANKGFKWYINGTLIAGQTGPTLSTTNSASYGTGLYKVVVDSLGCIKTDQINIIATLPVPYIGPDREICSPASYTLTTPNASAFPAGATYVWTKDGIVIPLETTYTLSNVTAPGTYILTASIAGCTSTSGQVILTSTAPVAVNACRATNGTLTLSVTNATGGALTGGPYNWYANSVGGSILVGGSNTTTFTTPSLSATTIYYVDDAGLYFTTTGPPAVGNGFTGQNQNGNAASGMKLYFDALKPMNLLGMTVIAYANNCSCASTYVIALDVKNASGTLLGTGTATVSCCPGGVTGASFTYPITFTTPVVVPAGIGNSISVNAATGKTIALFATGGATYPALYSPLVNITGTDNTSNSTMAPAYLDWKVSYDKNCDRVPVIATIDPSCPAGLPVELIRFTADSKSTEVLVNWTTANEINNEMFLIQRSVDGISFETIGNTQGSGNSNRIINYGFEDKSAPSGMLYYRLIQIDFDGKQKTSNSITVNNQKSGEVSLFPNPFNNGTNLILKSVYDYKIQIRINDISGRTLFMSNEHSTNEVVTLGEDLPEGLYIVELRSIHEVKTIRIIKINQ